MANKILTTVYDNHGNSYNTDVYVVHNANVNNQDLQELRINIFLTFYKDQDCFNSGFTSFQAITSLITPFDYLTVLMQSITPEQAPLLNAVMVQGFVTTYLKSIYGEDNVIEI